MTPQERTLLEDFLSKLARVQGVDKDPDADALIRQQAARQPDALYLVIQRSLLQEQALEASQARIQALEKQVGQLQDAARAATPAPAPAPAPRSFLGSLSASGWGRSPEPAPAVPEPAAARPGSLIGSPVSYTHLTLPTTPYV